MKKVEREIVGGERRGCPVRRGQLHWYTPCVRYTRTRCVVRVKQTLQVYGTVCAEGNTDTPGGKVQGEESPSCVGLTGPTDDLHLVMILLEQ